VLKEWLIAQALLERCAAAASAAAPSAAAAATAGGAEADEGEEPGVLQAVFPILVGRPHPPGHPEYPGMGSFFAVQGGGGHYAERPSAPSNAAAVKCLRERAGLTAAEAAGLEGRGVAAVVRGLTDVQGCKVRRRRRSSVLT
jgi:hypothetical protein